MVAAVDSGVRHKREIGFEGLARLATTSQGWKSQGRALYVTGSCYGLPKAAVELFPQTDWQRRLKLHIQCKAVTGI